MPSRCISISEIIFDEASSPDFSTARQRHVEEEEWGFDSPQHPLSPCSPRRTAVSHDCDSLEKTATIFVDLGCVEGASKVQRNGKLFLGSIEAVLALGNGDNPHSISAVLSCLPDVNEDVNRMITAAKIEHHKYFHLDDNQLNVEEEDCLEVGLRDWGADCGSPFETRSPDLREGLEFIHEHRLAGRNVLVHCDAGVLRSPVTVVSYLMVFADKSRTEASTIVKLCRPVVHIRPLEDSLMALEQSLQSASFSNRSTNSSIPSSNLASFEFSGSKGNGRRTLYKRPQNSDLHEFVAPMLLNTEDETCLETLVVTVDDSHEPQTRATAQARDSPRGAARLRPGLFVCIGQA